jgi:predicted transcriptional regulator
MRATPANRDSLREQAFALSAQGIPYRQIAKKLSIAPSTVTKYIREERRRRSRDRDAESAIRDGVSILRSSLQDQYEHLLLTHGTGPMGALAKAKLAESIRRTVRDLVMLYGVSLPSINGEELTMERMMELIQQEVDAEPTGYPDLTEETAIKDHLGSPNDIHREYEEWKQKEEQEQERRAEERERLREAERRMEEEAERLGFTSWEDVLENE